MTVGALLDESVNVRRSISDESLKVMANLHVECYVPCKFSVTRVKGLRIQCGKSPACTLLSSKRSRDSTSPLVYIKIWREIGKDVKSS